MFSQHPNEKMVTIGGEGCVDCVFHSANVHQNITWFTLNIHTFCLSKERAYGLDLTVNKRPCLLELSEGEGKTWHSQRDSRGSFRIGGHERNFGLYSKHKWMPLNGLEEGII